MTLASTAMTPVMASDPFAELDAAVKNQKKVQVEMPSEFEAYKKAEQAGFQAYMQKIQQKQYL